MQKLCRLICRAYVGACRSLRKDRLTLSAWAWKHFDATGNSWARNRIDGAALFLAGERDHCQSCHAKETSSLNDA